MLPTNRDVPSSHVHRQIVSLFAIWLEQFEKLEHFRISEYGTGLQVESIQFALTLSIGTPLCMQPESKSAKPNSISFRTTWISVILLESVLLEKSSQGQVVWKCPKLFGRNYLRSW
jgi:hypothetical protein